MIIVLISFNYLCHSSIPNLIILLPELMNTNLIIQYSRWITNIINLFQILNKPLIILILYIPIISVAYLLIYIYIILFLLYIVRFLFDL